MNASSTNSSVDSFNTTSQEVTTDVLGAVGSTISNMMTATFSLMTTGSETDSTAMSADPTVTGSISNMTTSIGSNSSSGNITETTTATLLSSADTNAGVTTASQAITTTLKQIISTTAAQVTKATNAGVRATTTDSMRNFYRDPLIAMSIIACLLFLLLLTILVCWCKKRGKTEYKTVDIIPKKATNGARASKADVDAKPTAQLVADGNGKSTDEIRLEMKEGMDNPTYYNDS